MKETMRERYEKIVERSREKRRHRLTIGVIGSVAAVATAAALAMPAIAAVQGQFDDPAAVTEQTVEQPTEQPDLTTMAIPSEESAAEKNVEQPTSEATEPVAEEPTAEPSAQSEGQPADNGGISTMAEVPGEHVDGGTFMGSENNELTWEVTASDTGDYTLTISGNGKMPDYANDTDKPWYNYVGRDLDLVIGDGITYVGTKNFNDMRLISIDFGTTLEVIGERSFDYNRSGALTSVKFPDSLRSIGKEAFVNDGSITEIVLNEGLKTVGANAFGWGASLSSKGCEIHIPSTVTSISADSFGRASYYTVADGNKVYSVEDGILYTDNGKTLFDMPGLYDVDEFTVPEHVKTLGSQAIKQSVLIKKVVIPETVEKVVGDQFRGCASLEEVWIADGVSVDTGDLLFYQDTSLQSIRLPENMPLTFNHTFSGNDALTELRVPAGTKSVQNFTNSDTEDISKSLVRLVYDARDATISEEPIHAAQTPFTLVIGANVDKLPANFAGIARFNSYIEFEPNNQITIEPGAFSTATEPLASVSGTAWVDDQGILYTYDAELRTATVVNIPANVEVARIPAAIEPEDGVECTVTAIGPEAGRYAEIMKSIEFEDASLITSIDRKAFANCTSLTSVTDKKTESTETTIEGVEGLFADGVSIGTNAFYNTGLSGAPGQGGFGANMHGQKELTATAGGVDPLTVTFSTKEGGITWVPTEGDQDKGGYELLTGQTLTITATTGNTEGSTEATYRVYLRLEGDDSTLSIVPGETITVNDTEVRCFATSDSDTYYFEFENKTGKTLSIPATVLFSSPDSSGGAVTVWAAAGTEKTEAGQETGVLIPEPEDDQVLQAYWTTKADDFTLTKKVNNNKGDASVPVDIEGNEDGTAAPSESLSWTIELTRQPDSSNFGKDYVRSIDYVDTIELPEGVSWSQTVLDAIKNGSASPRGSVIYADGTPIISVEGDGLTARSISIDDEGKVIVSWRYFNPSTQSEAAAPSITFQVMPEALTITPVEYDRAENHTVKNTVDATLHYTYRTDVPKHAESTLELGGGEAFLTLSKTASDVEYFGEDITYTLTLANTGAAAYKAEGTGSYTVSDTLSQYVYVKPSGLQKMFEEAQAAGYPLEVTIQKATLGTWEQVTPLDKTGEAWRTPANANIGDDNNTKTIVLTYSADSKSYQVAIEGGETYTGSTVAEALKNAGYAQTKDATYTCVWTLNNADDQFTFAGGKSHDFMVYGTMKSTFELVGADWPNEYPKESTISFKNSAKLCDEKGETLKSAVQNEETEKSTTVMREATIDKSVARNGVVLTDEPSFNDNDVLDYTLTFTHYGTGSYENLPMIDDLYGSQYLMVEKEKNSGLSEQGLDEFVNDGVTYYLLKPGEYHNVVVGVTDEGKEYVASKITVTKGDGTVEAPGGEGASSETHAYRGLHTKIEWYYDALPGEEYRIELTYKALVSDDIEGTGAFDVGNMVWMNDKPGRRIWAGLWGGGSIIQFDKDIVESRGEAAGEDVLNTTDHSLVGPGDKVTYRLKLHNTPGDTYALNAADIADALPNNYNVFAWDKSNISIKYVADGTVTFTDEEAFKDGWSVAESHDRLNLDEQEGQQYLVWPDNQTITFGSDATLYIYVTLTFPQNTDEQSTWDSYADAVGGATINNTLWVYRFASNVTHELKETGNVFIQKGVYGLYTGNENNPQRLLSDRVNYNNEDTSKRYVRYYALVMNTGNKRLYLNDLYDRLPEGFTYHNMESRVGGTASKASIVTLGGPNESSTFSNNPWVDLSYKQGGNNDEIRFMSAQISERTEENGSIRFEIGAGSGEYAVKYDDAMGKYYLDKNEAIIFGYTCRIGRYSETAKTANNVLAMPYTDYMENGVYFANDSQSVRVDASGAPLSDVAGTNDGNGKVMDAQDVDEQFDLTDDQGNARWITSEVSVVRGDAVPGVSKRVVSYVPSKGEGATLDYTGSVGPEDRVNWVTRLINTEASETQIMDFVVEDTIQYPYTFVGDVVLNAYNPDGTLTSDNSTRNLLTIAEHRPDVDAATVSIAGKDYQVPINGDEWIGFNNQNGVSVKLSRDDEGNETLSIRVQNSQLASNMIPVPIVERGGYAEISYSTINKSNTYQNAAYMNTVRYLPEVDIASVGGSGSAIMDGKNIVGVENRAPINVSFGYTTSSDKQVTEVEDPTNTATAMGEKTDILLGSTTNTFDYTLKVTNDADVAMEKLVLIDNLPEQGDASPFDEEAARNSAFKVSLASAEATVKIYQDGQKEPTTLTEDQYELQFDKRDTGFTSADWTGEDAVGAWAANYKEARSVRVVIKDLTHTLIPSKARVEVTIKAKVDGTAEPGTIAWNSFGYQYKAEGVEGELAALSMPVGVRVPSAPVLVKQSIDDNMRPVNVAADTTFSFVLYEGEALDGEYESAKELKNALSDAGRNYREITLTVPEGESASSALTLAESYLDSLGQNAKAWDWVKGASYSIVELPTDNFTFHDINDYRERTYTFQYDPAQNQRVTCQNVYDLWSLTLHKVDGDNPDKSLKGAVFALYTTDYDDRKTVNKDFPQYASLPIADEMQIDDENPRTAYLMDIVTLDESGTHTWSNLDEDRYYLLEVKAPDGYNLPDEPGQIVYRSSAEGGVLEVEVPNYRGAILPETGGSGTMSYIAAGTTLMAAAYVIHRMRRRRGEGRA